MKNGTKGTNGKNGTGSGDGDSAGLITYLAKLGLDDADLATVESILDGNGGEEHSISRHAAGDTDSTRVPSLLLAMDGEEISVDFDQQVEQSGTRKIPIAGRSIKLYVAEEQELLKTAYQKFYANHATIDLLGSSNDMSVETLLAAAIALRPDVMLLGVKTLQPTTVRTLERLHESSAGLAVVLLFGYYDAQGINALREFSGKSSGGHAYLLKHTLDSAEQLTQAVQSVAQGRIIVDPTVLGGLINTGGRSSDFLRELSSRELEVLSWIAKGYRNETIAGVLGRNLEAIERLISSIYDKMQKVAGFEGSSGDRRVQAALLYLKATGLLPSLQLVEN